MTYETFTELMEELVEAGVNPHDDIQMCKHYVTSCDGVWSNSYWAWCKEENPNPDVKSFQLL